MKLEGMRPNRSPGWDEQQRSPRRRQELNAKGTSLVYAELKDPVRAKLERYELIGPLDPDPFFPTLDAAVDTFRAKTSRGMGPARC
jgi:hypothetical protein